MDYYNKKTLQHYRFRNSFTFTLTTKLFFIFQIIQGLIFLKNHSIIHFDLKH
jgi:serine/threonine protein kinase